MRVHYIIFIPKFLPSRSNCYTRGGTVPLKTMQAYFMTRRYKGQRGFRTALTLMTLRKNAV